MTGIFEKLLQTEKEEEAPEIDPAAEIDAQIDAKLDAMPIVVDDIQPDPEPPPPPQPKRPRPPEYQDIGPDQLHVPLAMNVQWHEDDGPYWGIYANKPRGAMSIFACKWVLWDSENERPIIHTPKDWWTRYPGSEGNWAGEIPNHYVWWVLQDFLVLTSRILSIKEAVQIFDYDPQHTHQAAEARKLFMRLVNSAPEYIWPGAPPPASELKGPPRLRPGW